MASDPWAEFADAEPEQSKRSRRRRGNRQAGPVVPTGEAYDGDTFRAAGGANARLLGYDAFERDQQAQSPTGELLRIGRQSQQALLPYLSNATATPTGSASFGRPVVTLDRGGDDPIRALMRAGMGLALPEFLRDDPARRAGYMEAERLARLNRLGAHGNSYQTPQSFRQGNPEPWKKAEAMDPAQKGGQVVFWDEPTPFQGLRKDVADGYLALANDPSSTADDFMAFADRNGFKLDRGDIDKFVQRRTDPKYRTEATEVRYAQPPRVLTDQGDGAVGAFGRGLVDPINMADEYLGVLDSLASPGRENVWNSDRRFGDILFNNVEQNRSILAYDDANHPYARFGGQLASGLLAPGGAARSAYMGGARVALRGGASRLAAEAAGRAAVRRQLATIGGIEGGLAGAGAGETFGERARGGLIGAGAGAALGVVGGEAINAAAPVVSRAVDRLRGRGIVPDAGPLPMAPAQPLPPRMLDRFDLNQPAAARARDVLSIPPGQRVPMDQGGPRLDTAPPLRPAPAPRSLDDVMADVSGWAASQGAREYQDGPLPSVMLHGSPYSNIDEFDPYGRSGYGLFGTGTYLTDNPRVASQYTKKGIGKAAQAGEGKRTLYAVEQRVQNPLDMDKPADRDQWEAAATRVLGDWNERWFDDLPDGASNERFWREVEEYLASERVTASEGQETMDALIRSLGADGITHMGGGRVGDGTRHRVVIALDPEQTSIRGRLDVGSMLNPPAPRSPDWIDINAGAARPRDRLTVTPSVWDEFADATPPASAWDEFADAAPLPANIERPTLTGPRERDVIELSAPSRPAGPDPRVSRLSGGVMPGDVLPVPSNTVRSLEEAAAIGAGRFDTVKAPNPADKLARRSLPAPNDASRSIAKRGPVDLLTWLRTQGGVQDQGGDLRYMGVTNAARDLDFARGEQRFGRLVDPNGMSLDEAAARAWEAGYFPDMPERPTVAEFLDAIDGTARGFNRRFLPEDLDEVDRFEAAAAQRLAVERAQNEGAPMVADRGEAVSLADLEANSPPVTAYEEWGENAPDFAGNLRLANLDSPQAIKRALVQANEVTGGFDAGRRGRIAQAETEALASDLGMTANDLLARRKGEAFNAEQALAARQILAKSGNELVNAARRVQAMDNPGDEVLADFRAKWVRHVAIQEQVAGITAEAGRTLQQFRMVADSRLARGSALNDKLSAIVGGGGGADRLKDAAGVILDSATDPGLLNKVTQQALKPRFRDKLVELWYNSLLSGPATHSVNVMSNTLTALGQLPEHLTAAAIGAPRAAFAKAQVDRVLFSEVGARSVGLLNGTVEGLRQAARTFRTGEPSDAVTKVESQVQRAIPGVAGSIIRTPTRALAAEDELFKAMARRMELHGLAVRRAASEGLKGDAARKRAAELIENPSDAMLSMAFDYGRYLTFQRPLGPGLSKISGIVNNWPVFKLVLPFIRTPANILKYAAERSPIAPVLKEWRAEVAAGGAKRDLALARMAVGTGVGAYVASLAGEGVITGGGPTDPQARALLEANGWQPYSVRIGDTYYSYQRLDPIATTIGTAADLVDLQSYMTDKQREEAHVLVTMAILKNLSNKTWLSGVTDLTEAINDPERYGGGFFARLAGSVAVPTGVAQVARTMDPVSREARDWMSRIRSRIPFMSQSLPARRDVLGREVMNEGGLGPDLISPIYTRTARNENMPAALLAAGVGISRPQRQIGGIPLSSQEYSDYQRLTGAEAVPSLNSLVTGPDWPKLRQEDHEDAVQEIMRGARRQARGMLFRGPAGAAKPRAQSGGARSGTGGKAAAVDPWAEFSDAR